MATQKAELDKMLRRGAVDPWAVDFDKDLVGRDINNPDEAMKDSAQSLGGPTKSFSF